jgi:UDP-N-acetylmuramate--alanine ligase
MPEFGRALSGADEIVLTEIYAAGETPIPGVTGETLADEVRSASRRPVHFVPALDDVPRVVASLARPGDLVVTLGAGSIGGIVERILGALGGRGTAAGGRPCA